MSLGSASLGSEPLGGFLGMAWVDAAWRPLDLRRGEPWRMKRGDTEPRLRAEVMLAGGGPVDFAEAAVVLVLRPVNGGTVWRRECRIVSVTGYSMIIEYAWVAEDTEATQTFRAEIEVTRANGGLLTFPNSSFFLVIVYEDLR